MADRTVIKAQIRKLVQDGHLLLRREVIARAPKAEREKLIAQLDQDPQREQLLKQPRFVRDYQIWYSPALRVVEQLLPDRYTEFRSLYRDERRKALTVETYGIADYISGVRPVVGFSSESATLVNALGCFEQQIAIVSTAEARLDSVLSDIAQTLHSEILDDQLGAAKDLLAASHVRSAGVVAGVALEEHLKKLIVDHKVPFKKKAMLSNLNDALRDAGVYDVLQWRRIQHLTDVRNLCGHKNEREPKREEVDDLITETAKIVKTLF